MSKLQGKELSIEWAKHVLKNKDNYLILDTETTGLTYLDDIIQIGIIDLNGKVLLDTYVRPTSRDYIPTRASEIHGIYLSDLEGKPTLHDLYQTIIDLTMNKIVLIYNAKYDMKMFDRTCRHEKVNLITFKNECVMKQFSRFIGEWNEYYGNYKYQKLPTGDHTAIGDCKATLRVINKMAKINNVKSTKKKKWWLFW